MLLFVAARGQCVGPRIFRAGNDQRVFAASGMGIGFIQRPLAGVIGPVAQVDRRNVVGVSILGAE